MQNYYQILGVDRYASLDEIKKAYLKQMKKYHPDIYSGDTEFAQKKTAELNVIYSTLKQSSEREKYDRKTFGSKPQAQPKEEAPEAPNIFSSMWSRLRKSFESEEEIKYKPSKNITNQKSNKKSKTNKKVVETKQEKKQKPQKQNSTLKVVETKPQEEETEIDKEKAKLYTAIGVIVGIIVAIIIIFLIF